MQKTSQKRVTKVNDFLLKTFKTSTDLNQSLKKERKKVSNTYLESGKKTLQLLDAHQTQLKPDKELLAKERQYKIESEVKNLDHFTMAQPNAKLEQMIKEQKANRRERHYAYLNEYEKTLEELAKDYEKSYVEIRSDVDSYFKESDANINKYFDSYNDEILLKLDKTFIDELRSYIHENKVSRDEKISNLLERLNEVEFDRETELRNFVKALKKALIDIAFILEPEVNEIIAKEEETHYELVKLKRQENEKYVEEVNTIQRTTFEKFEEMAISVEKRWRRLKHDERLQEFMVEIVKTKYTNPPERNELYAQLKAVQVDVFEQRNKIMKELNTITAEKITKTIMEKILENIRNINDKAQDMYDECFDKLKFQNQELEEVLNDLREKLRDKLEEYGADLEEGETIQSILDAHCQPKIDDIMEKNKNILIESMQIIEDNDLKANELLVNITNFYIKIGGIHDEQNKKLKKFKFDYEVDKAKLADDNDERLDKLEEELDAAKKDIRQAVHHIKLDEYLVKGFEKLDEIEKEYREFHDKNLDLVAKHPQMIDEFYSLCEKELAEKFELVPEEKIGEVRDKYRKEADEKIEQMLKQEEKDREEAEKRAQEEREKEKGKKGGKAPKKEPKKDPKKMQKELEERRAQLYQEVQPREVQTYTSPLRVTWFHKLTTDEFTKEFFVIQEDEDEVKKKSKTVSKVPTQQDLSIQIDQSKKQEEAVKPDSKKDTKKGDKSQRTKASEKSEGPSTRRDDKKGGKAPTNRDVSNTKEEIKEEEEKEPEKQKEYFDEWVVHSPQDLEGNDLLSKEVFFDFEKTKTLLLQLLYRLLRFVYTRKVELAEEAKIVDNEFEETSMILLDQRLKTHYPLKGKLETEIHQIRSSEITEHKTRYERHIRKIIDKLDNQTERFNLVLEEAIESVKEFDKQQADYRTSLHNATSLSQMTGIQTHAKEHNLKFGENALDTLEALSLLTKTDQRESEMRELIRSNENFIKDLQLFDNGGVYSAEEVEWYRSMLKDIEDKVSNEINEREKRLAEIEKVMSERRTEATKLFEETYVVAIEDLAAKDGTGKKYGKPKRIAQEKLRFEMTKCEKSQECVTNNLKELEKCYELYAQQPSSYFKTLDPSFALRIRRTLMILRSCIHRYALHIEALVPNCPIMEMPRVTYDENRFDSVIDPAEAEADKKKIEEELEHLGPLFYQKDAKKFKELITEIEGVVKGEAQKLYQGKHANLLTGNDKIPDSLRVFLEGIKRQTEEFRISCCRQLRDSVLYLSDLSEKIAEMVFNSIKFRFMAIVHDQNEAVNDQFDTITEEMESIKQRHSYLLRPNLANPACKEEFEELNKSESDRLEKYLNIIAETKQKLNDQLEDSSMRFFKAIMNSFEFFVIYYDRIFLYEDFVPLPGDEEVQKKHANLKSLIKTKKTGIQVDRSTERCFNKKWPTHPMNTFLINKERAEAQETEASASQPKKDTSKSTLPPKKETGGKGKKGEPQKEVFQYEYTHFSWNGTTKEIGSFKTFRQKAANHYKNKCFEEYKALFDSLLNDTEVKYEFVKEKEHKYEFQWERTIEDIFRK